MDNLFIACIRNSRLGSCFPVGSVEEGLAMIRGLVKERLGRDLTEEEGEILEDDMEFYSCATGSALRVNKPWGQVQKFLDFL
jgi:hypothetical protein